MDLQRIVTGDDIALPVTLYKNGNTFAIDVGATIQASLVTMDRQTVLIQPVTVLEAAAGADWFHSLVVVELTSLETDISFAGTAILEIQVDDGGKTTFFVTVSLVTGTI